MKPKTTLRQALEDESLLGSALAGPTWHAWRSLLIAAMGEPLTTPELKTFAKFTGRTKVPAKRVDEFWCVIGRRGGKSRAMAVLAVYLAGLCDHPRLARGSITNQVRKLSRTSIETFCRSSIAVPLIC